MRPRASKVWRRRPLRQAFLQEDAEKAHQVWHAAADAMRQRWPKLGTFMDDSEHGAPSCWNRTTSGNSSTAICRSRA